MTSTVGSGQMRIRPGTTTCFESWVTRSMKRSVYWRLLHAFHNCVAHPLLPLAEMLDDLNMHRCAVVLFKLHDVTNPNDKRNQHVYF